MSDDLCAPYLIPNHHIVKETDGWYFWDEAGLDKYGPYRDREEARVKLHIYCVEVLGN
tara:strand:+ start:519 stop:692 length:174 start_codon:yes stop_codon:yes gene_type:complete